jgi:N-acetylmuramoyl-L-alanine amidase
MMNNLIASSPYKKYIIRMKNKALKRLIYNLSILLTSLPFFSFALPASLKNDTVVNNGYKIKTIVIDPGHGGDHEGSGPRFSRGASGAYSHERDVTLAIGLKLQKAIEKDLSGVRVVMTRSTDKDVDWRERAEIANQNKGDLFISIHCNALPARTIHEKIGTKHHKPVYKTISVPDHSGRGVLMLVYSFKRTKEEERAVKNTQIEGEAQIDPNFDPNDPANTILINEYKRKFRQRSINLANLINNEFVETDGRKSGGVIEESIFLLCNTAMPSVLVETGFIDNPDDEAYLNSEDGQNEIVASIVRAITNYKAGVEQVSQ